MSASDLVNGLERIAKAAGKTTEKLTVLATVSERTAEVATAAMEKIVSEAGKAVGAIEDVQNVVSEIGNSSSDAALLGAISELRRLTPR